jgi:hypothetical protein
MPVRSGPRRRLALIAALLVLAVLASGCDRLEAAVRTTDALEEARFRDPVVTVEKDQGVQTVTVDYTSGARDLAGLAAEEDRVARVVWRTMRVRLDAIRVAPTSDRLGVVPSKRYTRAALQDQFGRRPRGLDRPATSRPFQLGILVLAGLLLAVTALLVVGVIGFVRTRARRAAVPAWLADPSYPGWDGYTAAPPPPPPRPPRPPGRMPACSPVRKFRRLMLPPWLSAYTRSGSVGSTRQTNPSPPETNTQSSLIGP